MAGNGSYGGGWFLFTFCLLFFAIGTTVALFTMDLEDIVIIGDILLGIVAAGLILNEGGLDWPEIVFVIIAALHIVFSFSYDTMFICIIIEYLVPFYIYALMAL